MVGNDARRIRLIKLMPKLLPAVKRGLDPYSPLAESDVDRIHPSPGPMDIIGNFYWTWLR